MNYSRAFNKLNDRDVPMVDTHYYHWLEGYEHQSIGPSTAMLHYMTYMFGFDLNVDCIDRRTIEGARYIHQQYWSNNR